MTPEQTSDIIRRLADVPQRIAEIVADLSEPQLRTVTGSEQWSMAEVFAHLRASDDILAPRVYMMLVRDNPPLAAFEERDWAELAGYNRMDFRESLATFAGRRAEFVRMLNSLPPVNWSREGQHELRGAITVYDEAQRLIEHEEEHCAQLEGIRGQWLQDG